MSRKSLQRQVAEQQAVINSQAKAIDAIAQAAGLDLTPLKRQAVLDIQRIRRRADVENPAQPVPDPATEAPAVTTEQAATPQDRTEVDERDGASATENVLPDAQVDVTEVATVLDESLDLNEQDPTKPVAGTTEEQNGKLTGEVRTTDPTEGPTAFPLEDAFASKRTFAAIRLARLRMQSGIAPEQDDVLLGQALASDKSLSNEAMQNEIQTLSQVLAKQPAAPASPPRNLVPRAAVNQGGRQTPSMGSGSGTRSQASSSVSASEVDLLG